MTTTKSAPRCVTSRGHDTKGLALVPRTRNQIHPTQPDTPPRAAGVKTIRGQLLAAAACLETAKPTPTDVRAAQGKVIKALAGLDAQVQRLALIDADGHRKHAIKTAKTLKDARGRRRAPVTMPGYNLGRTNPVKGRTFKPTPPSVNDVLKMIASASSLQIATKGECPSCGAGKHRGERHSVHCCNPYGERLRATLLLLWRGGFRVGCELTRLTEDDLHPEHGFIYVADGKNHKPREVGIDDWIWPMLEPWLAFRSQLPDGPLLCVLDGPTAGVRRWDPHNLRLVLHRLAAHCEIKTRVHPHAFRHAMAIEQVVEGIPELYVSRNLGHADLGVTSRYLQGLPQSRVRSALRSRPVPQISMIDALRNEGVEFKRAGQRTMSGFNDTTVMRGWAFALRDLCDQGALDGRLTIAPGVVVLYSPLKGARFLIDGQPPVTLTDTELDDAGLLAVSGPSGKELS